MSRAGKIDELVCFNFWNRDSRCRGGVLRSRRNTHCFCAWVTKTSKNSCSRFSCWDLIDTKETTSASERQYLLFVVVDFRNVGDEIWVFVKVAEYRVTKVLDRQLRWLGEYVDLAKRR